MAPFSDPQMHQPMDQYWKHDHDPQFLYRGSQEDIVKELEAWVVHRKEVYKERLRSRGLPPRYPQVPTHHLAGTPVTARGRRRRLLFPGHLGRSDATLAVLEAREKEERLRANAAEI
ncbi:hypothetical protein HO133_008436 [Letharia lupina]|uniref:Uncharacterized protein n=1 Tax=Letharia lupina TaxID=560253 RepID=A0A8H6CNM5_9LECA|nr:uncharacterized protein HO133_008436 [Letharia lupina]KAF6226995.1 hypothetical protein HO133_008436 [Letharia lupina]